MSADDRGNMTHGGVEQLEDLIARLERAAEQLRSGEVSADVAATMVEDCAALATQAATELERLTRDEGSAPPPGQDTLL
jgi:exonuclease VII small subunit